MERWPGVMDATLPEREPPLVTVVIICYNAAPYLAAALDSALAQTYPRVEVIVVDDGSTDETASIAQSYPVKYLHQENRGSATARNAGIAHTQGEYVLFLDHDDRLLPRAIEIGVGLLEEHPECAIAVGEHRFIAPDGSPLGYSSNKRAAGGDHYRMLLEHNFIETPCSALHRRSGLASIGLFDETVQGAEDYELYLRTARQGAFIAHGETVAEYRLHGYSATRNAERMLLVTDRVLAMEMPYLQGDPELLRLHRRGVKFFQRHYGRRLTRELMANRNPKSQVYQRKLKLLRHHYGVGFTAVIVSRLLPANLVHWLLAFRSQW